MSAKTRPASRHGRQGPRSSGEKASDVRGQGCQLPDGSSLVVVAWGVEEDYGRDHGKGRTCVPGALKRAFPQATHLTLDLRGIMVNDPSKASTAPDFEEMVVEPCCVNAIRFVMGTVSQFMKEVEDGQLVLSLCCSHGRNRSRLVAGCIAWICEVDVYLPTLHGLNTLKGKPPRDTLVQQFSPKIQQWLKDTGKFFLRDERYDEREGTPGTASRPTADPQHQQPAEPAAAPQEHGRDWEEMARLQQISPALAMYMKALKVDKSACLALCGLAEYSDEGLLYARNLVMPLHRMVQDAARHDNPSAFVTAHCREKLQWIFKSEWRPESADWKRSRWSWR